ncbi:hypothetical protein F5X96DRAFT_502468 [Biscogniauxia mediterranea]|nr:hypothetical protein F5X96DRAFT_502468 [Biscogniauxia mediterranea]
MPATTKMSSTNNVGKAFSPIERLPSEVKMLIFTHFTDLEDVTCLRVTSRSFDAAWRLYPGSIVRGTMQQLAGSAETLRLVAMAVESSRVSSSDKSAVESIMGQYIDQGEIPESFFTQSNFSAVGAITGAGSNLVSLYVGHRDNRMLRSLLRIEIAKNLFHDTRPDMYINFDTLYPELEEKYWRSYSAKYLGDLSRSQEILSYGLGQAIRTAGECPEDQYSQCECAQFPKDEDRLKVWLGHSQQAGLVSLGTWALSDRIPQLPFNPYHRENRSHHGLTGYSFRAFANDEFPETIIEIATKVTQSVRVKL